MLYSLFQAIIYKSISCRVYVDANGEAANTPKGLKVSFLNFARIQPAGGRLLIKLKAAPAVRV